MSYDSIKCDFCQTPMGRKENESVIELEPVGPHEKLNDVFLAPVIRMRVEASVKQISLAGIGTVRPSSEVDICAKCRVGFLEQALKFIKEKLIELPNG